MNEKHDSLDQAMQALKTRSREWIMSDLNLENRIMQEFGRVQAQRRRRLTTAVVASLAIIFCSVGFTAGGGVEIVRGWFGRVELVDPSGNNPPATYALQGTQLLDANGNAVGQLSVTGGDSESQPATVDVKR